MTRKAISNNVINMKDIYIEEIELLFETIKRELIEAINILVIMLIFVLVSIQKSIISDSYGLISSGMCSLTTNCIYFPNKGLIKARNKEKRNGINSADEIKI